MKPTTRPEKFDAATAAEYISSELLTRYSEISVRDRTNFMKALKASFKGSQDREKNFVEIANSDNWDFLEKLYGLWKNPAETIPFYNWDESKANVSELNKQDWRNLPSDTISVACNESNQNKPLFMAKGLSNLGEANKLALDRARDMALCYCLEHGMPELAPAIIKGANAGAAVIRLGQPDIADVNGLNNIQVSQPKFSITVRQPSTSQPSR